MSLPSRLTRETLAYSLLVQRILIIRVARGKCTVKQTVSVRGLATTILSLILLTACGSGVTPSPSHVDCPDFGGRPLRLPSAPSSAVATATTARLLQDLDAAENQWQAANINHYRITVRFNGFGSPGPYSVEVQNGVVIDAPPVCMHTTNAPCLYSIDVAKQYTVPGLFAAVRHELNNPCQTVSVTYAPVYGYPSTYSTTATVQVADADYGKEVIAFMPLP